ncbi:hypothetical protein CRENBAI_022835 [Crenichthys baileyi]|uniref:Uncharacterized protein n=1 Tax=Crenichthys baileyi TaxID=28760 RepID=A0AAV9RWY9_9TELE
MLDMVHQQKVDRFTSDRSNPPHDKAQSQNLPNKERDLHTALFLHKDGHLSQPLRDRGQVGQSESLGSPLYPDASNSTLMDTDGPVTMFGRSELPESRCASQDKNYFIKLTFKNLALNHLKMHEALPADTPGHPEPSVLNPAASGGSLQAAMLLKKERREETESSAEHAPPLPSVSPTGTPVSCGQQRSHASLAVH